MQKQEIFGSRYKAVSHILFAIFLIGLGWLMTNMPDTHRHYAWEFDVTGWFLICVAVILTPEHFAAMFKPPVLTLDGTGFSIKTPLFRERRYNWKDITEIYIQSDRGPKRVRWKYDQSEVPKGRIKLDGTLSKIWAQAPEQLLLSMKKYWEESRRVVPK
jgi:hypothetical protein